MIKSKLIKSLAADLAASRPGVTPYSEKEVSHYINEIIEIMTAALSQGNRIEIRGFGSFSLHYRPPRNAHNPKTGERVLTIAKYRPHFKPGKELRDRVNESAHTPIRDGDDSDEE